MDDDSVGASTVLREDERSHAGSDAGDGVPHGRSGEGASASSSSRPRAMALRARGWCFTVNERDGEDITDYEEALGSATTHAHWRDVYITYGREICPTTDRRHLQGYIYFPTVKTMKQVKDLIGREDVHLEPQMGTCDQAITYCHKENNFVEFNADKRPKQGKRRDLEALVTEALNVEGASDISLLQTADIRNLQQLHFFNAVRARAMVSSIKMWEAPKVHWYHGPTGTGKTHLAMAEASANGARPFLHKMGMGKWWPGAQDGTTYIVWDEFRPDYDEISYSQVLALLGIGRCYVEVKGASIPWCAKEVWITSPHHPAECGGKNLQDSVAQLLRRVTDVKLMEVPMTAAAATAQSTTSSTFSATSTTVTTTKAPDLYE